MPCQIREKTRHRAFLAFVERRDERLHLSAVEPQTVAVRTAIDLQRIVGPEMDHPQPPVATRTLPFTMLLALGPVSRPVQSFAESAGRNAGCLGDRFQLAGVEPNAPAINAAVELDAIELESH